MIDIDQLERLELIAEFVRALGYDAEVIPDADEPIGLMILKSALKPKVQTSQPL
jgi:hypothetical protein